MSSWIVLSSGQRGSVAVSVGVVLGVGEQLVYAVSRWSVLPAGWSDVDIVVFTVSSGQLLCVGDADAGAMWCGSVQQLRVLDSVCELSDRHVRSERGSELEQLHRPLSVRAVFKRGRLHRVHTLCCW